MRTDDGIGATRRDMIALLAVGGATLAAGTGATASAAPPRDRLRTYMLMRGALDERLVIGFISGRYYGVVGDEVTPLYGVVGATFARYRRRADGGYDGVSKEVPYFVDLATGAVIDHFRNPYTGEDVKVVHGGYPAARIVIGPDLKLRVAEPMAGMTMDDGIVREEIVGGDLWLTEQTLTAFQAPGMPKPIRYSEVVTMHARVADLDRPAAKRVPCETSYTSIVSWRPWLKMGDRPGHLVGTGVGGYGASIADLPQGWRDGVAARQPGILQDPAALLPAF